MDIKTIMLNAALAGLFTSPCNATLLEFNASGFGVTAGTAYNSLNLNIDGISVSLSAFTINNDDTGTIYDQTLLTGSGKGIYVDTGNIGVKSTSTEGRDLDAGSTTSDLDEGILFTFDQIVQLDYLDFDSFTESKDDDFNLTVDGISLLVDFDANESSVFASNISGKHDEYIFSGITGTRFLVWADGSTDSFRIDSMKVSAVPEPNILLLFFLGLTSLITINKWQYKRHL